MADSPSLNRLLNIAGHIFKMANTFGTAFVNNPDVSAWPRFAPEFDDFCKSLLTIREPMMNPPDGFAPVAECLREVAKISRSIRETNGYVRDSRGGFTAFFHFAPDLNTSSHAGYQAIEAVIKARRLDDPLAFVDELPDAAGEDASDDPLPPLGDDEQFPSITKADREILLHMLAAFPETRIQADVTSATGIERKLAKSRMAYLREKCLTHRPQGDRKGDGLTASGKKLAEDLQRREQDKSEVGR